MKWFAIQAARMQGGLAKELLVALGASALVLAAVFGTFLYVEELSIRSREIAGAQVRLAMTSDMIAREFEQVRSHLHYLAGSRLAAQFFERTDAQARADIESDWLRFAESTDRYDQLSLLDAGGREVLRINQAHGERPVAVGASELQDKSDRYYFRDAISLASGAVYVSPLDLNVEGSKIEQPHKPALRFAMPLYRDGRLRGLLVLNYRARRLIDAVRTELDSPMSRAMLLNAQGYWLAAPDPADEWGFMLENGRTMELRHPELWTEMRSGQRGRFQDSSGLYLYRTVYPLDIATAGAPLRQSGTARKAPGAGYSWILASWISPAAFVARYSALRRDVGLLFLVALGLVLPLAAYAALARARQRKAKRDLRLASRVFEATGDAVLVTDRQFRIIRANAAFTTLTGWEFAEIAGQEPEAMFSPSRTPAGMGARIRAQLATGGWQGMLWLRRASNGEVPAWASVSQVVDARGLLRNCVLVFNDMTERMREEERVRILAERDALTGLPNRRLLDDRLGQAVARARRSDTRLAVLFIDLDRLKGVNDEGGHDAGDAVLQATARRLTATLRASDTAARLGGDEFVVLLDGVADRAVAQAVAHKLELAIEYPTEFAGRHYLVGASIGVRLFPEDGDSASALLHAADEEMYSVKARHRLDRAPVAA